MNDPLALLPGYALRRASSAMLADLGSRLAALDLRTAEASALVLIGANAGIRQRDLCQMLDIQRANMTPLIAKLETRGLIARAAADGRSQGLTLTRAGEESARSALAAMHAHENFLMVLIPEEHRDHLIPTLTSLWQK